MSTEFEFDVFLSHNSEDKSAIELIARRLKDDFGLNPFLDKWNLVPGATWPKELERALDQSATTAVFLGAGDKGPWHDQEMQQALVKAVKTHEEYRIIPVLLPGADNSQVGGFLGLRTWVDFRAGIDDEEALKRLVGGIKGEAIDTGGFELPDEPAPYRGLSRFEKEQANFFFGRNQDIERLVAKLSNERFLAVVGASGSGKSSLVRAGLLPRLEQGALPGSQSWRVILFMPGTEPLRALANQLVMDLPKIERKETADRLVNQLGEGESGLRDTLNSWYADAAAPLLLIIDQFEELFTQSTPDTGSAKARRERNRELIAGISDLVRSGDEDIRVIITLRADFLARCLEFPLLRELLQDNQLLLGELGDEALREAVVLPAQKVGAFFEAGLVSLILRDVTGERGSLPLLQHALFELWKARHGPWLTQQAYEEIGGVTGALKRFAQRIYDGFAPDEQKIARNIFVRITSLGEGVSDTRRRVLRSDLYPADVEQASVDCVIEKLSGKDARLIVAGDEGVEVTHESLLQEWDTLRGWLDEDRDAQRLRQRIGEAARLWQESGNQDSDLYTGGRLELAEQWEAEHPRTLNELEQEFFDASRRKREVSQRQRRNRVLGLAAVAIVATVLAVVAVVSWRESERQTILAEEARDEARDATAVAEDERQRAEKQAKIAEDQRISAESRLLASQATEFLNRDESLIVRAMLLAVESLKKRPTDGATRTLRAGLGRLGRLDDLIEYEKHRNGRATSVNGRFEMIYEATKGGWNGQPAFPSQFGVEWQVRLLSSGEEVARLRPPQQSLLAGPGKCLNTPPDLDISFGVPNSAGTGFRYARIKKNRSGMEAFLIHEGAITACSVSDNGELIVTASGDISRELPPHPIPGDQTVRIWRLPPAVFALSDENLRETMVATAFSTTDDILATASDGESWIRVFDLNEGTETTRLKVQNSSVTDLAFSADGRFLASAPTYEEHFDVFAVDGFRRVASIRQQAMEGGVSLSPKGKYLVTNYGDGGLGQPAGTDLWLVSDKKQIARFGSNPRLGEQMSFTPNGKFVLTIEASPNHLEKRFSLWEAASGELIEAVDQVLSYTLSANGERLVLLMGGQVSSTQDDGTYVETEVAGDLQIWSMQPPTREQILEVGAEGCTAVSPSGRYLAFCNARESAESEGAALQVISLLDLAKGGKLHDFTFDEAVLALAFSPDGLNLAIATYAYGGQETSAFSVDNVLEVRNVETGAVVTRLRHGGGVDHLAFSRDGRYLASEIYLSEESGLGKANVWMWRPKDLEEEACRSLPRNMTLEEWRTHMPDASVYRKTCDNLPVHPSARQATLNADP